jgi:hypothetical protein
MIASTSARDSTFDADCSFGAAFDPTNAAALADASGFCGDAVLSNDAVLGDEVLLGDGGPPKSFNTASVTFDPTIAVVLAITDSIALVDESATAFDVAVAAFLNPFAAAVLSVSKIPILLSLLYRFS